MQKTLSTARLLCAIFLLGVSVPVFGQLKFDWLTTSNGLSQGYVYDILQDKDGFIWFATKDGLNRYDGYSFKVYTHDSYDPNSISNNNINRLFEDSKGRLWVATDNGLNVYDKSKDHFSRIMNDPKNESSLSGNRISLPIIELADGRFLAFPHEKSLNVISLPGDFPNSNKAPSIVHLSKPAVHEIVNLYKDGKGKVWLIADSKLYEFDPANGSFIVRRDGVRFGESANSAAGDTWTNDAFFSKIEDGITYPLFSKDIAKGHGTFFLHEKDNSKFWLGITDSAKLELYDLKSWKKGSPLDPEQCRLQSFSDITPTRMYQDRSGIVWVGTNGYGIRKYVTDADKFHHLAAGFSVRSIMGLQNNQVYIRGWDGLKRIDLQGYNFTAKDDQIRFNGNIYNRELLIAKDYTIWGMRSKLADTAGFLVEVLDHINPVTKSVKTYSIKVDRSHETNEIKMEDSKGNIWLTSFGGNFIVLNPVTGQRQELTINTDDLNPMLSSAEITALYEDPNGIFWAGTETGLAKIEYSFSTAAAPKISWYKSNAADKSALNYAHVSSIVNDAFDKNILWVATKGGGLNRLNKTTNQFVHVTTKEGLCNNVVYGLLCDDAGNLWGSTNNGIFCLLNNAKSKQDDWQFRHFTRAAGLQDDEFNTGAYAKLANGNLAFGGINGINIFDPAVVLQSGFSPNVFITNILIGNEIVLPNDNTGVLLQATEQTHSITLNHLQDIITLEFSSLDYTAPNQNKYRYQLVGIDKNWVESGTRHTATYVHLPSGSYTFKVQGSNSQGMWSDNVVELKIKVLPPWWRTWWAYLFYALLISLAIRAYLKFTVNRAKLKSQLNFEQQEAKRIKDLDVVKTQLYANITHEFRTPLTVILGMANQVKSDPEKHLHTGVDMIVRNGENLLNLVNEMLDLSKLENGKMKLNLIKGDIISFLRYIVESFQSLAASQKKQFHFLSDADELLAAYDAEKIRQIITNLFSNALKFTPEQGNVYVSVSQETAADSNSTILVVKVKDTGIGIPENQLPHIFDRFYQLDNSHTRKAEGTGIGLALTKELVKLMNGNITVKSPPVGANRGTEFIISIPLAKATVAEVENNVILYKENSPAIVAEEKAIAVFISEADTGSFNPLVLLVEDNTDVVAYTASCLPDYKLAVGKDGREGFEIATEIIPDLIITDVMMPFVDGFEMCRKLRQDERTSHIPIIMLTAKADMQSKLEGIEKGADVYLEKPFHKEELLLRIKKLLELRKNLQQYYSRQIGIAGSKDSPPNPAPEPIVEEKAEHEFVKKVRDIVEANFINYDFSVEQLCKLIFMSHSQLHRKLEALTGCSPNKFIRIVRLNKAKDLLANPATSIAAVAMDCGYNDAGYFARVFKQDTGMTPQEWRSRNL